MSLWNVLECVKTYSEDATVINTKTDPKPQKYIWFNGEDSVNIPDKVGSVCGDRKENGS